MHARAKALRRVGFAATVGKLLESSHPPRESKYLDVPAVCQICQPRSGRAREIKRVTHGITAGDCAVGTGIEESVVDDGKLVVRNLLRRERILFHAPFPGGEVADDFFPLCCSGGDQAKRERRKARDTWYVCVVISWRDRRFLRRCFRLHFPDRDQPGDQERRDRGDHHPEKEISVTEPVADEAAQHRRDHHARGS